MLPGFIDVGLLKYLYLFRLWNNVISLRDLQNQVRANIMTYKTLIIFLRGESRF